MKHIKMMFFVVFFIIMSIINSFAFHQNWYQENGHWKISDALGNTPCDFWLLEDTELDNPLYLFGNDCNMVIGLAQVNDKYYFLESQQGVDFGKLRLNSGNYDGVNLDIDSSGAIKNLDGIKSLKTKYKNYPKIYMLDTKPFPASAFLVRDDAALASSKLDPPNNNENDIIWDDDELNTFISQVLEEFDSSYLQFHAGVGLDATSIVNPLKKGYIWTMSGQPLYCTFLDPLSGQLKYGRINRTPENIRWAIYQLK